MKLSEVTSNDDSATLEKPLKLSEVTSSTKKPEETGLEHSALNSGLFRGAADRALGVENLLNNLGIGKHIGLPGNEVINEAQGMGKEESAKHGTASKVGEFLGDPLNYVPVGGEASAAGKLGKLALAGGASGLTSGGENSIGGNLKQGAVGAVAGPAVGKVSELGGKLLGKGVQSAMNKSGVTEKAAPILEKFGIKPKTSQLYDAAKAAGIEIKGKSPKDIYNSLDNWYKSHTNQIGKNITTKELDPIAANLALSHVLEERAEESKNLYNFAAQKGKNITQKVPNLESKIQELISNLENSVSDSERAAVPPLKRMLGRLLQENKSHDTGIVADYTGIYEVPKEPYYGVDTLLDLKTELNNNFNPKKFSSKSPLGEVFTMTKNALKQAGDKNKEFGQALNNAETHHINRVVPIKYNEILNKFWKPQDYLVYKNLDRYDELPDTLKKRAESMLKNIKSPVDLDLLTRNLPHKIGDSLRKAKFKEMMAETGLDAEKIKKNYPLLKQTLSHDPSAQALLDHMKDMVESLNQRGIGNMKEYQLETDKSWRSLFGLMHKAGAIKHAAEQVSGENVAGPQKRLLNLKGDLEKGQPMGNVFPGQARNPIKGASAVQVGKNFKPDGTDYSKQKDRTQFDQMLQNLEQ